MKYKPYPKYKPSGVEWLGKVPEHWNIASLKRVCTFSYGDSLSAESRNEGTYPVFGSNGIIGYHDAVNTQQPVIIVGRKGSFGKVVYSDEAGFAIDTTYFIDKRHSAHNLRWLYYLLQILGLDEVSQDTGVPGLSREKAYEKTVFISDLQEQNLIAKFLDRETARIDALIEKKEAQIRLLQEKRQALISHAVTKGLDPNVPMKDSGIEWLGQIPEHWSAVKLKRTWSVIDCKHVTAEFFDTGFPLASIQQVQSWYVDLTNANKTNKTYYDLLIEGGRKPRFGDVIMSRNVTVGQVALVPENFELFAMGQDVCLLRKKKEADSTYLKFLFESFPMKYQIEKTMIGSTFRRINVDAINNLICAFPPIEEQRIISHEIIKHLKPIEYLVEKVSSSINFLREHRSALITTAVTGQIDVREMA